MCGQWTWPGSWAYSKASISYGLGNLKKEGCVVVKAHGSLELTEKGAAIARGCTTGTRL